MKEFWKTFLKTVLYVVICVVWALLIWYWILEIKRAKRIKKEKEESKEVRLTVEEKE